MARTLERTLTITDSFMFGRVMRNEEICKGVLERVLGLSIDHLVYRNTEQEIDPFIDARSVQLDLYLKDDARVFDVEMQVRKRADLAKRLRYYQSVIDTDILPKGSSYEQLRESYIIFLCAHDPFGDGLPVYTIERTCLENSRIIGTGAHWLALNCRAYELAQDEGVRNLLEYLENGRVARGDDLLGAMDAAVTKANADRKWVSKVLSVNTIYDDARHEGLAQGRAEGHAEGRAEGLVEGRAEGLAEGLMEGEARYNELVSILIAANRLDDLKRAVGDASYRQALFEEFAL